MKKRNLIFMGMFLLISIFLMFGVLAETSYCCEKIKGKELWCQNAPANQCEGAPFKSVPTSCESTSYCKLGTCVNTDDGTCMPNTPQIVCQNKGGVWKEESLDDIPQCQLGCCLMGEQAAFVTQTKCSALASAYGLEIDFRSDIHSEVECIASAGGKSKGACVFEQGFVRTCRMGTKEECNEMQASQGEVSGVVFHEDYLCSAEELGTECGPSEKTTCVEEKEDVYFLDTCGNIANVYDSKRVKDKSYWTKIIKNDKNLCGPLKGSQLGDSHAEMCGNCDYEAGSICSEHTFTDSVNPKYGDYFCRDLGCDFDTNKDKKIDSVTEHYEHGESWCVVSGAGEDYRNLDEIITVEFTSDEESKTTITQGEFLTEIVEGEYEIGEFPDPLKYNLPGTRHYRLICYNGEVLVEPCADFRQEVCYQGRVDNLLTNKEIGFRTAACKQNMWQDCIEQTNERDCENLHQRDCVWYEGGGIDLCAPLFAPGFDFWAEETDAQLMCARASDSCTIKYERKFFNDNDFFGDDIEKGFSCNDDNWQRRRRTFSLMLGDCGVSNNYLGYVSGPGGWNFDEDKHKGDWN